ncbi:MAG: hypothetical protein GC204_14375 [Chloroflexi bacterium]|nr:hypothetical protein [Chloroflexota bacterium]
MLPVIARLTLGLAAICAILSGAVLAFGKSASSSSGIIYAMATDQTNGSAAESAILFDPQQHIRYNLTRRYGVIGVPVPSADGQKFAYLYHDQNFAEIRVLDYASGRNVSLYQAVETSNSTRLGALTWSPSGRFLAFSNGRQILKYDFATKVLSVVTPDGEYDSYPSWSADESQLAFASPTRETGHWQIYTVNADGSNLHRITRSDVCLFYIPHWSPRSNLIAIDGRCENTLTLFVYNVDGAQLSVLTHLSIPTWGAVWSPDGSRLLFTSGASWQEQTINVMNVDGSGEHSLAIGINAYWSPDGKTILLNGLTSDLYVINVDGADAQRLAYNGGTSGISASAWSH